MTGIHILIAEDEKKIADALCQGLEENGFTAAVAYDGAIALKMFRNIPFQLVIADINLPGLNGYELCHAIRAANASVPVVMLTAMSALEDKIEGFDAGADDYIVKPFDFRELLVRIRALLKRTHTTVATGTLLQADDLVMNLDSKQVTRKGQPIQLTAKEFQLLEYFLRNKNRVVSRADIALQVWDIDFDTRTNVIDVYVNYLRKKIDKGFDQPLIYTQVGMGYVLKDKS
ncbi:MAG TPA: response regulator transcription factor [Chitinophagaceae bacterium]|nr:response regulator transcription factor [Chitinophagaceae bacterium]HRF17424.1 response regulator transcription factor [Chitinophagaceae bacterium]